MPLMISKEDVPGKGLSQKIWPKNRVNILSSYKDQIKANVFAQLLYTLYTQKI